MSGTGWGRGQLVALNYAVAQVYAAPCMARDVGLMGDEDNSIALLIEAFEQRHDLFAGFGIEVAGWLVSQNDRRIVDQCPGNCHPLALSARKFAGLMS